MHWRFDPFISIEVLHQKYSKIDVATGRPLPAPDFEVIPTRNSEAHILRSRWLSKPFPGGCNVLIEKIYEQDGVARPRRQFTAPIALDFLLRLKTPDWLLATQPFAPSSGAPPPEFPTFSGRKRVFYFDNHAEFSTGSGAEIDLTMKGDVRVEDLASLASTPFCFPVTFPALQHLQAKAILPSGGGISQSYNLDAQQPAAVLDLPEGPWQITPQSGAKETIFLDSDLIYEDFLAIIRIFKSPGSDWDTPKKYKLFFLKTEEPSVIVN